MGTRTLHHDEALSSVVTEVLRALAREGVIYHGAMVLGPVRKAGFDIEVESRRKGQLGLSAMRCIRRDFLIVAPRGRKRAGDVAARTSGISATSLLGQKCYFHSTAQVPVIAGRIRDPEFGTGCVKAQPDHTSTDFNYDCEQD